MEELKKLLSEKIGNRNIKFYIANDVLEFEKYHSDMVSNNYVITQLQGFWVLFLY